MAIIKLKEIGELNYSKNFIENINGNFPIYATSGIVSFTNSPTFEKNSIILPRVGSFNIFFSYKKHSTKNTAFSYKTNEKIANSKYIYFKLLKTNLTNENMGSAVPRLTSNFWNEFKINIPTLEIQKFIIDIIEPLEQLENNISMQVNKINFLVKNLDITNQKIKLSDILESIQNSPKNLSQVSAKVLMKNTTLLSSLEPKGTYATNSFYCPKETFLFCSIRTYLQKYCILPIEADVNGTLFQFKIKENFTSLLTALQNNEFWEKTNLLSTGTKMPIISKKDFLNIEINKTKIEIKNLIKLLVIQNEILLKLTKLKKEFINLLIK